MAESSDPEELKREIQELTAENVELKQKVQLLLDNPDRKIVFRSQYNDSANLLPVHESSRLDGQDHFGNQPFLDCSSFAPNSSFQLSIQHPYSNSTPQLATPPMTPAGAGPVFMGQLPFSGGRLDSTPLSPHTPQMFTPPPLSPRDLSFGQPPQAPRAQRMQQFQLPQFQPPPVARLNLWSPPQNLLRLGGPGTPDSGMQGAGFLSPEGSSQEYSFRSSSTPGRFRGRGYCWECPVPLHPHLLQNSLADSVLSGRMNQSGFSSDGSAQNFSSSSAVPGNQLAAAAGSPYGPGSRQNSPLSPGSPFLGTSQFSPTTRPDIFSQPPAGKVLPSSPGALPLEMLGPQSPAPYFPFPSSQLQTTPIPAKAQGTKVPQQTPSETKTKEHGESNRQATSVTMKKSSKESKQVTTERIVGEIAFQLDRRILSTIFPDRIRLYGFTVGNIPEKIRQNGSDAQSGLSEDQCKSMMERYNMIMTQLKPLGYDPSTHPKVTEQIVNSYGILRERPDTRGTDGDLYNDVEYLRNIVQTTVPASKRDDCMMLLNCLHKLSQDDGKPLFIW